MTVIAVTRKNNKIAMAADSLITIGQTTVLSAQPKVQKRGDTIVGITGVCGQANALMAEVFNVTAKDPNWPDNWTRYCLDGGDDRLISKLDKQQTVSQAMVVWNGRIFQVTPNGSIFETADDFSALGCGNPYALGAMVAVWDHYKDPATIARIGCEAACQLNAFCSLPVVIESVKY